MLPCLVLLVLGSGAAAAERVRVFELGNRTGMEIKAMVEPLVGDSVTLSATGFRLLARGPEAELQQLARLVERLDAAAPEIVIETRRVHGARAGEHGGGISGSVGDGDTSVRARGYSSRSVQDGTRRSSARGQAGTPVYISHGISIPVSDRDIRAGGGGTSFRRLSSGFYATASVSGERVRVEIHASGDSLDDGNRATRRRLLTTVNGRLGEWMAVGATEQRREDSRGGIAGGSRSRQSTDEQLWLRIRLAD